MGPEKAGEIKFHWTNQEKREVGVNIPIEAITREIAERVVASCARGNYTMCEELHSAVIRVLKQSEEEEVEIEIEIWKEGNVALFERGGTVSINKLEKLDKALARKICFFLFDNDYFYKIDTRLQASLFALLGMKERVVPNVPDLRVYTLSEGENEIMVGLLCDRDPADEAKFTGEYAKAVFTYCMTSGGFDLLEERVRHRINQLLNVRKKQNHKVDGLSIVFDKVTKRHERPTAFLYGQRDLSMVTKSKAFEIYKESIKESFFIEPRLMARINELVPDGEKDAFIKGILG